MSENRCCDGGCATNRTFCMPLRTFIMIAVPTLYALELLFAYFALHGFNYFLLAFATGFLIRESFLFFGALMEQQCLVITWITIEIICYLLWIYNVLNPSPKLTPVENDFAILKLILLLSQIIVRLLLLWVAISYLNYVPPSNCCEREN